MQELIVNILLLAVALLAAVEVHPVGFGAATIYSGVKTTADYDFEAEKRSCPLQKLERGGYGQIGFARSGGAYAKYYVVFLGEF